MNQPRIAPIIIAAGLAALLSACASGSSSSSTATASATSAATANTASANQTTPMHATRKAMAAAGLHIKLLPQNGSGQTGTASVVGAKGGVDVSIDIKGEPKGVAEPAHIHPGTCAKLNPVPWKMLTPVTGGKSMTHLAGVTVAQILKGTYAINVHNAKNLKIYVSCGDLKS